MGTIQYVNRRRYINTGKRDDFSSLVKGWFNESRNQMGYATDICHRVSYKFMADALMNAFNFFLYCIDEELVVDEDVFKEEIIYYIRGVIVATILTDEELLQLGQLAITNTDDPMEELNDIFSEILANREPVLEGERFADLLERIREEMDVYIEAYVTDEVELMDEAASNINELCEKLLMSLNNSISNLFLGMSSWNRSIGECFDPKYPVETHEVMYKEKYIGKLNIADAVVFSILVEATKPGGENFNESELSLYAAVNSEKEIVLYSSAHKDSLPKIEELDTNVIMVYYNCFRKKFLPVNQELLTDDEFMAFIESQKES